MDIALGVSMTPTTVRMVLVEGEKADGVTVDHDVFEVASAEGSANAAEQVVAAVLGTRESAEAGGHRLRSIGVAWGDHAEATALRDALAAHDIDDVMLVSEGHAAGSLAQAAGRAVGYEATALLFVNRDVATLSVVRTDDGSVVKVLSRTLHSSDAMAVLTEMAGAVDAGAAQDAPPQGLFVVGSGLDIASVKAHLEHLVSIPVNAPEDAELALARGAALASATAPAFEATTVGLAYSQDPDGPTAGSSNAGYAAFGNAETQLARAGAAEADSPVDEFASTEASGIDDGRKPFLLVGSALTSIFVIGVVALAISLAISIRPTADERPSPAQAAIVPSPQAPAPAPVEGAVQVAPDPPSAETIKPPVPVVQEAPQQAPRTVFVEQPPAPAPPAPAAPAPAPAPAPVVAPPVIVPPPVIIAPRPIWTWPSRAGDEDGQDDPGSGDDGGSGGDGGSGDDQDPGDGGNQGGGDSQGGGGGEDDGPLPTQTVVPTYTQTPQPRYTQSPQPTYPQAPQPTYTQQTQAPRSGSSPGSGGSSGSGGSGRSSGSSGSSGSRSGSGVPGDLNGDGCFLVFCRRG